jgi:Nickel-containing superoxide dismutase
LFNQATKQAGAAGGKGSVDPADAQKLLDQIAEIDTIFWETKNDGRPPSSRTGESPTPDLASIVTDDATKQGNPGKPQSLYQQPAGHLDGPDDVSESAPI